jgi:hypothetical protein
VRIAAQAIQLGDDKDGAMEPAQPEGFNEARAVILLAALNLHRLGHELPVPAEQIGTNGFPLCLEAQARASLLLGADALIGDELALRHGEPSAGETRNRVRLATAYHPSWGVTEATIDHPGA